MNSKEIQENVVKAVENCGLAIYKNAPKIVGNYQYQTGAVTISTVSYTHLTLPTILRV